MKLFAFALFSIGVSCLTPDPWTPIVARVHQAGAGDPRQAGTNDLVVWMDQHTPLAFELQPECTRIAQHVPNAHWVSSTEGRICRAVIHTVSRDVLNHPFVATN